MTIDELRRAAAGWTDVQITGERLFDLGDQQWLGALIGVDESGQRARVSLLCNMANRPLLHWGIGVRSVEQWRHPPRTMQPRESQRFDDRALRSSFERASDTSGRWKLELSFEPIEQCLPRAINCVLYDAAADRWLKHEGHDIQIRIQRPAGRGGQPLAPILEQIVDAEAGTGSWTLMHRFNLCYDLLDEVERDPAGMALLFAWLRFSAIRQLDWQRNYNTKPRDLAHAQHRLTTRLAALTETRDEPGRWARRMLATVGRGGEGQQVRDQILHIMHRHGIKEKQGTWIEQWHQKLHNNTTPDDIVICQAYIAFLEGDGDEDAYWRTLEAGSVTRSRLENFERPITLSPEHHPQKKNGLLHDFHAFLRLLKSVHAGTDLETSIDHARSILDPGLADWLARLAHLPTDSPDALAHAVAELTEARRQLHQRIGAQRDAAARRDLIYVDLGLEAQLRTMAEGAELSHAPLEQLAHMAGHLLGNLALVEPAGEYGASLADWHHVELHEHADRETLLLALAATERASRAVRDTTDGLHARLQPLAEQLGRGCGVEPWAVPIFSEEVVRGDLAFVLAKLARHLEPALRRRAGLGGWQIISPGDTIGRVRRTEWLRRVQDERFDEPTILIADEVAGDEEIPANVRGVLTRQMPDIVSHVAVRARNEHVLLASCLDAAIYDQLQAEGGRRVHVRTTASGDLHIEAAAEENEDAPATGEPAASGSGRAPIVLRRPPLRMDVVGPEGFTDENVGGKSRHLMALRDRLPGAVGVPPSAALTFGCFEHTLEAPENRDAAARYAQLAGRVDTEPEATLPELRQMVNGLVLPEALRQRIEAVCREQGLALPEPREGLWSAIRRVWASKWTDRAYRARRRLGLSHDDLVMAVLLQEVVHADYAFVIHTTDPTTGDANTLYAEVVVGLGETLVSNEPGLPLGFRANKEALVIELVSLPSKSIARRARGGAGAGGLIARSDANGEDLPDYAGAGLHDSVLVDSVQAVTMDYTHEPLVRDRAFRERLCRSITELGIALERAAGSAQDIEGAVVGDRLYALQTRPQVGL